MKRLFLLCGIAFSGKSTLARSIGQATGMRVISLDAINQQRGLGLDGEPVPNEEWEKTHHIALEEMSRLMGDGSDLLIDDTNCFRWIRDRFRDRGSEYGYWTTLIHLRTDPGVALERLLSVRTSKARASLPEEFFAAHVRSFEPPGPDESSLDFLPGENPEAWMIRNGIC